MPASELLIEAGRLFLPGRGFLTDVAVRISDGRLIEHFSEESPLPAQAGRKKFPKGLLLPGLADLHAHPVQCGSIFGVNADRELLPHGVTTVLSQGDVGALALANYHVW